MPKVLVSIDGDARIKFSSCRWMEEDEFRAMREKWIAGDPSAIQFLEEWAESAELDIMEDIDIMNFERAKK